MTRNDKIGIALGVIVACIITAMVVGSVLGAVEAFRAGTTASVPSTRTAPAPDPHAQAAKLVTDVLSEPFAPNDGSICVDLARAAIVMDQLPPSFDYDAVNRMVDLKYGQDGCDVLYGDIVDLMMEVG